MDFEYVLDVLRNMMSLEERLDMPAFPRRGVIPIKFRGGEEGQFRNPLCWSEEGYLSSQGSINTYLAMNLFTAMTYALTRSVDGENPGQRSTSIKYVLPAFGRKTPPGGRFDLTTGDKIEGYQFGFPYVLAINYEPYRDAKIEFNGWQFSGSQVSEGEISISVPISRNDIFMLFGTDVDYFKDIPLIAQSSGYQELLKRRELAIVEDPSAKTT